MGERIDIPVRDKRGKIRKHVYLSAEQVDRLAQLSVETNRSESDIVGLLIDRADAGEVPDA